MKPSIDWISIEGAFRSGKSTLRDIASQHGITEGAIRKKAKQRGWLRDPSGAKRERVKAIMAGTGTPEGTQYAERTLDEEASQDVKDMGLGLQVARACLSRLLVVTQEEDLDPKSLKLVAEANLIAVNTIRRIRGLDESTEAEIVIGNPRGAVDAS